MMPSIKNDSGAANTAVGRKSEKLFDIINEMICSIEARDVAALLEQLTMLESGLSAYFAAEKNNSRLNKSDFSNHAISHQSLLNKIKRIKDGLIAQDGNCSKHEASSCMDSLWYYLLQHIEEDEKFLKFFLETDFYDFAPNRADSAPFLHCSG